MHACCNIYLKGRHYQQHSASVLHSLSCEHWSIIRKKILWGPTTFWLKHLITTTNYRKNKW
jgi:hypothetical protein